MTTSTYDKVKTIVLAEPAQDALYLHASETTARANALACLNSVFQLATAKTGKTYDRQAVMESLASYLVKQPDNEFESARTAIGLAEDAGIKETLAICAQHGYTGEE